MRLKGDHDVKVHVIVNLLPDGGWRKEWITSTNITGSERDAVVHMRDIAKEAERLKIPVLRQKIEVPAYKLPKGRGVLYVEAHIKALLSMPNMELALKEQRNVSVNVAKPGNMMMTFRAETQLDVSEAVLLADLPRFLGYSEGQQIAYEAAIVDSNPDADNDWIRPWRVASE